MKAKSLFIFTLLCLFINARAQLPVVNLPLIPAPAQSVYLAPNGNDANNGTFNAPKKSFSAAIAALNFGVAGINGGNSYVEVILKPGDYYPAGNAGFFQNTSDWRSLVNGSYVYKNISIRGLDNVTVHGDSLNNGVQVIFLMGNGISIKNVKVKNSKMHGIVAFGSVINHHNNLLVDSVETDNVYGNGIWVSGYDQVLVQNSAVLNTCMKNYNGTNCIAWPSGMRVENCGHATIRNNMVYHNWGEGLNTSYVRNVQVQDNEVFDNYSVNLYCHSSSNAIYSHNLIYNSDSTYWRYCLGSGGKSAIGISCANELACTDACAFYGNTCGSLQSCCSYLDYDHPLQEVNYYLTDSVYIFNNIVLNAGIDVWDAASGFANFANLSNFYIAHNSVVGVSGNQGISKPLFGISLGTPFINYENINIQHNVFSSDTTQSNSSNLMTYVPTQACSGDWGAQTLFSENLWNKAPVNSALNFSMDDENSLISQHTANTDLTPITPAPGNPELVYSGNGLTFVTDDYFHHPRNAMTNVGAIEYQDGSGLSEKVKKTILVYPNPTGSELVLSEQLVNYRVFVYDLFGKTVAGYNNFTGKVLEVSSLDNGLYFLVLDSENRHESLKFSVLK